MRITLRDFAVCPSLRRSVNHRFIQVANYSKARNELRAFSFCRVVQNRLR